MVGDDELWIHPDNMMNRHNVRKVR